MFFSHQGNAPVVIICVTLVGVGKKKEIEIRLCECISAGVVLAPATVNRMKTRFKLVRDYLDHHLSPSYTVLFKPPAIVTTATDITAATRAARTEAGVANTATKAKRAAGKFSGAAAKDWVTAAAVENAIVLISPGTCTFASLTDWWYSARAY